MWLPCGECMLPSTGSPPDALAPDLPLHVGGHELSLRLVQPGQPLDHHLDRAGSCFSDTRELQPRVADCRPFRRQVEFRTRPSEGLSCSNSSPAPPRVCRSPRSARRCRQPTCSARRPSASSARAGFLGLLIRPVAPVHDAPRSARPRCPTVAARGRRAELGKCPTCPLHRRERRVIPSGIASCSRGSR